MPVIDTRAKRCLWCDTTVIVFPCPCCAKDTCRECLVYYDEEGTCRHVKVEPTVSKSWT